MDISAVLGAGVNVAARLRRASAAVIAGLIAASLAAVPEVAAVPSPPTKMAQSLGAGSLEVVEELPAFESLEAFEQNGFLVLDPSSRRGYQFFRVGSSGGTSTGYDPGSPGSTVVWSFDLDTLAPIRRAVIAGFVPAKVGSDLALGGLVHDVDESSHRLFIAGYRQSGLRSEVAVAVIDEDEFGNGGQEFVSFLPIPALHQAQLIGSHPFGLTFFESDGVGKLLVLFSLDNRQRTQGIENYKQAYQHSLAQWDAETGAADWTQPVRLSPCERLPLIVTDSTWTTQLEILRTPSAILLACRTSAGLSQVLRIALVNGEPGAQTTFPVPSSHGNVIADQVGQRLLIMMISGGVTWWVFDARTLSMVGSMGAAAAYGVPVANGLDPVSGRLYSLVPDHVTFAGEPVEGGLLLSDTRLTPAPQFRNPRSDLDYPGQYAITVDPAVEGRSRRVFVRRGSFNWGQGPSYPGTVYDRAQPSENHWLVVRDTLPIAEQPPFGAVDQNTIDAPLKPGETDATFDGSVSGFGFRSLLIAGVNATVNQSLGADELEVTRSDCYSRDREVAIGVVDSTSLSSLVTRASSSALFADSSTMEDLARPTSRCWPETLRLGLPSELSGAADNAIGESPLRVDWDRDHYTAGCVGDEVSSANRDEPLRSYTAKASCNQELSELEASASGTVAPSAQAPVSVAHATSSVTARVDPARGLVTTVESIAKGIEIVGLGRIGLVAAEAETWARGRPGTAGSNAVDGNRVALKRTICGVEFPNYSNEGCLTEAQQAQFIVALNSLFGRSGEAKLRQPDPNLARGSNGGYLSSIQRRPEESFSDRIINRDSSAAVPALEFTFYRTDSPTKGAGRQLVQLAAVQASSAFGIYCLRGEQTLEDGRRVCNEPPKPDPGKLKISLADDSAPPKPLPGGLFKVYSDVDENGILGQADKLIEGGSCLTAEDGVGNCHFAGLAPGSYVIEQTKAPAGYQAVEPFAVELVSGSTRTVEFTNLLAVGVISLQLTDDSADRKPLQGGVFEVYADDGDEVKGPGDLLYASCTTDARGNCRMVLEPGAESVAPPGEEPVLCLEASGVCLMAVPLGPYVVHQAAAPEGYDRAADVGFSLNQPGDLALLSFANGLTAVPGSAGSEEAAEGAEFASVEATPDVPGTPAVPPTESVVVELLAGAPQPIVSTTPMKGGGLVRDALGLPATIIEKGVQGLKLLFSSPVELGLMATVWLLVWAPCYLGERRRLAARSTTTTAGATP